MYLGEKIDVGQSNNYVQNVIEYDVLENGIVVGTACENDYGRVFSNNDSTFIAKGLLPNWLARKLYVKS